MNKDKKTKRLTALANGICCEKTDKDHVLLFLKSADALKALDSFACSTIHVHSICR